MRPAPPLASPTVQLHIRSRCFAMLALRMARKPSVAIVGAGRLGSALAHSLRQAGYEIREIISHSKPASLRRAKRLAQKVGAVVATSAPVTAEVIWLCVPDRAISACAEVLARTGQWREKIVLHSSGALSSRELNPLKRKGAAVGSAHPLMTFVAGVRPSLEGVPFAVEGNMAAVRVAKRLVKDVGGKSFAIDPAHKGMYHAWGAFISPLLVAMLVTGEHVARNAGLSPKMARRRMQPIIRQTLANYFERGPGNAFSGPIIRGDVATVAKHLRHLKAVPEAKHVYVALAKAALKYLPAGNRKQLRKIVKS